MMRMTWCFLTRQRSCWLLALLILTVPACATPFSNNTTPLAQNTPIVYADDSGNLQAISGRDGSLLWHTSVGGVASAQIIVGDAVYTTVFTSAVAVRLSDGQLLWRTAVPYEGGIQHLFSDGQNIVVDSGQAGLTGLDPSDGSIRWSRQVQTAGRGVLYRGVYYIHLPHEWYGPGGTAPALAAYRASDGVELWTVSIPISEVLFANENMLFANFGSSIIVALSLKDGHQLWSQIFPLLYIVGASPRMALVNEPYKTVDALDAMNGDALWSAASADFSEVGVRNSTDSVTAVADRITRARWRRGLACPVPGVSVSQYAGRSRWRSVCLSRGPPMGGFHAQPQIAALDAATGAVYWRIDVPHGQGMAQFSDAAS